MSFFATAVLALPALAAVPGSGRVWELVSNLPPGTSRIFQGKAWDFSGDRIAYVTVGPTPGAVGGELNFRNLAVRESDGWHSEPVSVPFTAPEAQLLNTVGVAVDSQFSSWLWESVNPLAPGGPSAPTMGIYRRDPSGDLRFLASLGEVGLGGQVPLETTSDDLRRSGFNSSQHLLPADAGRIEGRDAYEITDGGLRMAAVDDAGEPLSPCGSIWGGGGFQRGTLQRVISADGQRAFVTSPDPQAPNCGVLPQVYLREGGDTIAISASHCTRLDCNAPSAPSFVGASSDGSRSYFLTSQQLLDDDTDELTDLYGYDAQTHTLRRVSAGVVQGLAGVGSAAVPAIGDRVYFSASSVEKFGAYNLYLREGGSTRFIVGGPGLDVTDAVLSPDGAVLVFATVVPLVPGDKDESQDLYRYDARDGSLRNISAAGGRGNEEIPAEIPRVEEPMPRQTFNQVSADGEHVFFETTEALLPEDQNEIRDVYEWSPAGLGLVSSGFADEKAVLYAGASGNGLNAYFTSRESLVPADTDGGEVDIYAARIGGGFPPAPQLPECSGEACRSGGTSGLPLPLPATEADRKNPHRKARRGRFSLARIGIEARRQLAAGEEAALLLRVPDAGRVSLLATANLRGLPTAVGRDRALAWRQGRVSLHLQLSSAALRQLRANGGLRLQVTVRYSGNRKPLRRQLKLRSGG
jgi:hypothetical protein